MGTLMNASPDNKAIALVISDVDGTLLDPEKKLTPGALAAVARLRQAGIRFTIASARPPGLTHQLSRDLQLVEPAACFNGALIIAPDCSVLHQQPMRPTDAQKVADHLCQFGLDLWVYTGDHWYVSNPTGPHVEHQEGLMGCKASPLTTRDLSQFQVLKLVGVSDDYDKVAHAEELLDSLCCVAISATRSSQYYLDVTHADANKGTAVEKLSEMLKIPRWQIATIGDMMTDALMFRLSGLSIAMGNAPDDVKKLANDVTKSNEEDGFAYAMDHFVLGRRQIPAAVN